MDIEKRYPTLRAISGICKGFGWGLIVCGIIILIMGLISVSDLGNMGYSIGFLVFTTMVFFALILFFISELIHVLVDIEENTRKTSSKR